MYFWLYFIIGLYTHVFLHMSERCTNRNTRIYCVCGVCCVSTRMYVNFMSCKEFLIRVSLNTQTFIYTLHIYVVHMWWIVLWDLKKLRLHISCFFSGRARDAYNCLYSLVFLCLYLWYVAYVIRSVLFVAENIYEGVLWWFLKIKSNMYIDYNL